jgi:hypothetical protein
MPRGLVRDNNLSDLENRDQALINLGINIASVERIQGVAFPGGVEPTDIQRIAGSSGNFQDQIDGFNRTLTGYDINIHVSGSYVPRAGGPIFGTWTQVEGYIQASGLYQSGSQVTPSSDSLFTNSSDGTFTISTSSLRCDKGLSVEKFVDAGNIIMSGTLTPNVLYPITINGIAYNLEAARL